MPSYAIKQSTTAYPLVFLLVDSSDHITGKTGLSPTVKLSKAGAAGAAPSGAVSEIDATNMPGWYKVAGNATDSATLGPLLLHATGTGADPTDALYEVVAFDPQAATNLGLSGLPTANPGAANGLVIAGTNAPVTITGSGNALTLTSTGSNGVGLAASGNGSGAGLLATGGATGIGLSAVGGATSGDGMKARAATTGHGLFLQGTDSGFNGLYSVAGISGGYGIKAQGGNVNGGGIYALSNSSGPGLVCQGEGAGGAGFWCKTSGASGGYGMRIEGGNLSGPGIAITTTSGDGISILPTAGNAIVATGDGTSKHGAIFTGGTAGTSDGLKAAAGTGGVDIRGNITGNLTGTVSTVTTVGTLTTYTGNTPQTGDSYARIGANGANLTALGDTRLANLDTTVSSRSTYAGADTSGTTTLLGRLTSGRATNLDNLDAAISTRSTFAGGAVASVTAPVTISQTFPANFADFAITASTGRVTAGTVSDKTGYSLAAAGLDSVVVESGINARQALAGILSTSAGKVSGMEANAPIFKGGGNNTTRLTAVTDADGNRTSIVLNLPT